MNKQLNEEFKRMQKLAGVINENEYQEQSDEISITPEIKAFIDKVISDAKRDDEFEYLKDVDFFDNDLIDLIMDEFDDDGNYNDVSQEIKDYITNQMLQNINENQNKVYGIEKDYEPYDFGPYTKEEAEAKAEEYHKKDSFSIYKVELYNSMRNKLTGIDRMHTPRLDTNGNFMDLDQPFSSGDLADY